MTVQYAPRIRINMPVEIGPYTFTLPGANGQPGPSIDLTGATSPGFPAVSVSVNLKLKGAATADANRPQTGTASPLIYTNIAASFVDKVNGIVTVPSYMFTQPGIWEYQFVCLDASNNPLEGEPVQFSVVPNVLDVSLNQLA